MTSLTDTVPQAVSISHQHIVAIINTLTAKKNNSGPINVLDLGCGDGRLISHVLDVFSLLRPELQITVKGLDVSDAAQQAAGYMDETRKRLSDKYPSIDWNENLTLISSAEQWPYADNSFDFIISNQVLEHVVDHYFLFNEIRRCLVPGGYDINLFPLKEVLWEGHALMPLVHKVRDFEKRKKLILFFSKIGFKTRYFLEMESRGWNSLEEYAHIYSDVLEKDTNYLETKQCVRIANSCGLDISFTYSKDLFSAKALSYIKRRTYDYSDWGVFEKILFYVGRYLSSATVILQKSG